MTDLEAVRRRLSHKNELKGVEAIAIPHKSGAMHLLGFLIFSLPPLSVLLSVYIQSGKHAFNSLPGWKATVFSTSKDILSTRKDTSLSCGLPR